MISSVAWVPRGCAMENPVKFEPTEEELDLARAEAEMAEMAIGDSSSSSSSSAGASTAAAAAADVVLEEDDDDNAVDTSGLPADLKMDEYDEDEDDDMSFARGLEASGVDLPDIDETDGGDENRMDSDEEEDTRIKPSDAILLAAHAEDEYSCLEVYVYDRDEGSLFVHHDIALPAFPLTLAWMGHPPGAPAVSEGTSAAEILLL